MKSWTSLNMGHVGSKTRSLGQILEKPSAPSRDHIFNLILITFGQKMSHVWSKTRLLGQIIEECMLVTRVFRI